jgi:hypothetical protein
MNKDIESLVDEVEDFDLSSASYQVWCFYLGNDRQVVSDKLLFECDDPEEAVNYAKKFICNLSVQDLEKEGVTYYEFVVETVVDFGEYTENVATIFREIFEL